MDISLPTLTMLILTSRVGAYITLDRACRLFQDKRRPAVSEYANSHFTETSRSPFPLAGVARLVGSLPVQRKVVGLMPI